MLFLDAIYLLVLILASPWLVWRRVRYGKNRRGWSQKLLGRVPVHSSSLPAVWLHAVSVGEVNLLPALIRELKGHLPESCYWISTTTESGYDQAVSRFGAENVFFCPADFSWAVRRAVRRIRPTVLILSELELWPNLLAECQRQKVPVALINARMSDRSFARYRSLHWLSSRIFRRLDLVCAQTGEYARRFASLSVPPDRIVTAGNLKFDGANTDRQAPHILKLARQMELDPDQELFVAGSTQPEEDRLVLEAWLAVRDTFPDLKLVVVPRHPHNADAFCQLLGDRNLEFVRRSQENSPGPPNPQIIVVDVIGELPAWWGLATVGYVGGSMGKRGGQSMIEPAALGVPVCFGPHTWNFRDVVTRLLDSRAATVVQETKSLEGFLNAILDDGDLRSETAARAKQVVAEGTGSGRVTALAIARLLLPPQIGSRSGNAAA